MADSTDVILQLANKQWSSATRARDRMASVTNALVIAAAVLQGAVILRGFEGPALLAAGLIMILGLYGGLASLRYGRRFRREMKRFGQLAGRLDELAPDAGLVALEKGPLEDDDHRFPAVPLVPAGLVLLGILNIALILAG
jgi:hypothetical protein